LILGI